MRIKTLLTAAIPFLLFLMTAEPAQGGVIPMLVETAIIAAPYITSGTKPGDTIHGSVGAYEGTSNSKKDALIEDGKLAKAAYADEPIPDGYRPATQAEFSKYIGLDMIAQKSYIKYDQSTGYFGSIGNKDVGWLGLGAGDGNGLDGRLLINETDGSIVLAFRGSEPNYNDWVRTDFAQPVGGVPEQYKEASQMLNFLVSNTSEDKPAIKVVGHSLGGGLASYSTLNCTDVSRVTTVTYNAAGLYPDNVNTANITQASRKINNVRVDKDVVSQTGLLVGNTYVVDSTWFFGDGNWIESAADRLQAHSMDTLLMLMQYSRNQNKPDPPSSSTPGDNSTPSGDLVTNPGSGGGGSDNSSGGVCLPGDGTPSGDSVSSGGDGDFYSHIGEWGYYPETASASGDSVSDPSSIVDAASVIMGDIAAIDSLLGDSPFGSSPLLTGNWSGFPIVLPNFGYSRILFLYGGEKSGDMASDVIGNLGGLVTSIRQGLQSVQSFLNSRNNNGN